MRYFLEVSYKGSNYHGWQRQNNAMSVQEKLEDCLATLLRQPVATFASGRTDTGVHAEQQIVQLDCDLFTDHTLYRINKLLPNDISIKSFKEVTSEASARFDALTRTYEYRISTQKNPFLKDLVYYYPTSLDLDVMNEASQMLLNHTDFESFSKVHTDVFTFNCSIDKAWWEKNENLIVFTITANRFLRGMVRAIVGTLFQLGLGKINAMEFEKIIVGKNRALACASAPPEGLFLTKVTYPDRIFL